MKQKSVKRRKKSRKLLLAVLMLLLTGGLLATTSYAWFTANKTVTVSNINVNVAAANGLQISVDAVDWKATITNEDILGTISGANTNYTTNNNQLPLTATSLAPVSSVGATAANGFMDMYLGEIEADENTGVYHLSATKDTETKQSNGGHFIAFDLFFQVQEDTQIYLTEKAGVVAGETNSGIHNAARIAFINEGNKPAGTQANQVQALVDAQTPIFWEPNYDVHTAAGIANASSVYGKSTTATGAARLGYFGVKAPIAKPGELLNSTAEAYFKEVTPEPDAGELPANYLITPAAGVDANAYQKLMVLKAGITKVRIYMWVEGQDVDCENNASGGDISFNLQFSSNKNSAGEAGSID